MTSTKYIGVDVHKESPAERQFPVILPRAISTKYAPAVSTR